MKRLQFLVLFISLALYGQTQIKEGFWRGYLLLNETENIRLPLRIKIEKEGKYIISFLNAEEKISVESVKIKKDSLHFRMPVFDSEFHCRIINDSTLNGEWWNKSRTTKNKLAFVANLSNKYSIENTIIGNSKEKWECTFSPGSMDSSKAAGIFNFNDNGITGTFLTETGDYRYLQGEKTENKIYLSCFDGSHAFLFEAKMNHDKMEGVFYSGSHWKEKWIAVKNENYTLRDPESITLIKDPQKQLQFSFLNTEGKTISLDDARYAGKVVIVQIMGSWCPNCMDETKYLAELYKKHKDKGLEIIAVAFEKNNEISKARENVKRLKNKFGAEYEFLITGLNGKDKASETFSNLNAITAFPTTIFIDKNKIIRNIHTGYNGPATGAIHESFKEKTEYLIQSLLKE